MKTALTSQTFFFSHRGSWLSISRKNREGFAGDPTGALCLRTLDGVLWEESGIFEIELERAGVPISWSEKLTPAIFTLRAKDGGSLRAAFQDKHTLRLRAEGMTLRLKLRSGKPMRLGPGGWGVRAGSYGWLLLAPVTGTLTVQKETAQWALLVNGESAPAELLVHRTTSGGVPPEPEGQIEDCAARVLADLETWEARFPCAPEEFAELRKSTLWNLWNLVVHPLGNFKREAVLVSKRNLVGLWSWDHCWHMLGTATVDPELAWNNLMAMFDHQDANGALPDVMSVNQLFWGVLKPPVHGWMLGLLEERHPWFNDEHRREIYPALVHLTEFWLRQRDEDNDGVPHYLDGCDSGWDNATVFDAGFPIETPDLSTWLVLQQDWLAKTARKLGLAEEAERWEKGSKRLLAKLLEHFWTGKRFVARMSGTHEEVPSDSLLLRIPLLLGTRLPESATAWCLDGLYSGERYRSSFGILTEPSDSPFFKGDGYWRGPMWPVATFIFVEAFRVNGREQEAKALMLEYLRHVMSAGNFENYRGDNGKGVRDTAIAWTATCVLSFLTTLCAPSPHAFPRVE